MADATIQQSGGDFSSINAFIGDAGTSGGDTGTIQGTWTVDDTTAVTWNKAVLIRADSSSRQAGRPWDTGDTTYRHRVTSGHAFTVTAAVDIDDINIQSSSTGVSDEIFRCNSSIDLTLRRCMVGFEGTTNQQDICYSEVNTVAQDWLFEQCFFYDVDRAIVDLYNPNDASTTWTIDFNSCGAYNVGAGSSREGACWVGVGGSANTGTYNVNSHNSLTFVGTVVSNAFAIRASTSPLNVSHTYGLTDQPAADLSNNENSETTTGSGFSYTWTDGTPGAGSVVALTDITTAPYDPTLQDNANNDAQDFHSTATGSGLTIPSTDVVGGTRPVNTNYDVGPYEVQAAGQTVAIGLTTETDSAFAAGSAKAEAIGLASETDQALAATAIRARVVALALETDQALAATIRRALTLALALETDQALAITAAKLGAVGLALETDQALAAVPERALTLGQALETDTALKAGAPNQIGLALETDQALATSSAKLASLGQALETDAGLAANAAKVQSIGISSETDQALAVTLPALLGLAVEADQAIAFSASKLRTLGQALETDQALAAAPFQAYPITQALETDQALAVASAKGAAVGLAAETDQALDLTPGRRIGQNQALETDQALAMALAKGATLGLASEIDSGLFVSAVGGVTAPNVPGIVYTAPAARLHLSAPGSRLHYLAPEDN